MVVDPSTLAVTESHEFEDLLVNDLVTLEDGRVIGVGAEVKDCERASSLVVLDLSDPATPKNLYRDDSPFETEGSAIVGLAHGRLVAVGAILRRLDIEPPSACEKTAADYLAYGAGKVNLDTRGFLDTLVVQVDLKSGSVRRSRVEAGSDVILRGGFVRGEELVLGGRVGAEAAWLVLKNPDVARSGRMLH
jgi:hypothetical protein